MKRFHGRRNGPLNEVFLEEDGQPPRKIGDFDWGRSAAGKPRGGGGALAVALVSYCMDTNLPVVTSGIGVLSYFVVGVIYNLPDEWTLTDEEIKTFFFKHAILASVPLAEGEQL